MVGCVFGLAIGDSFHRFQHREARCRKAPRPVLLGRGSHEGSPKAARTPVYSSPSPTRRQGSEGFEWVSSDKGWLRPPYYISDLPDFLRGFGCLHPLQSQPEPALYTGRESVRANPVVILAGSHRLRTSAQAAVLGKLPLKVTGNAGRVARAFDGPSKCAHMCTSTVSASKPLTKRAFNLAHWPTHRGSQHPPSRPMGL